MSWVDIVTGISRITKLVNNLELQFKGQDEEIKLLRRENADLRKEVASITERLARLEEARNTTVAEVKTAMTTTLAEWELRKLRDENDALRRGQIPSSENPL